MKNESENVFFFFFFLLIRKKSWLGAGWGAGSFFSFFFFCICWKRGLLLLLLFRDALQFFNHIGRDTFPPALFSKRFQIATLSPAATADSRTGLPSGCPRTLQDGVTASRRKAALGNYNYVANISAEMATVLRNQAPILIRLREKMELHLCTVFHSNRYPITLKTQRVQAQNAAETRQESTAIPSFQRRERTITLPRFAVLHMLYSEHIFRKPIEKTHTRCKGQR